MVEIYLNFLLVLFRFVKVHGSCITIEGINGIGVSQQLRQEGLEYVGQI